MELIKYHELIDRKYYLYRHIRLDKNEPFYIGIGTTNKGIYTRARSLSRKNNIWNKIIEKTDYRVEILLEDDDRKFIEEKEIEFIKLYGRIDLGTGILANLTDGGEGSNNLNDKARKFLSEKLKKNNPNKDGRTFKGKFHTEESKQLMSSTRKGKRWCPLPYKTVYQYSLKGEFIKEWQCAERISEALLYNSNNIRKNCTKNSLTYKGFIFSYLKSEEFEEYYKLIKGKILKRL